MFSFHHVSSADRTGNKKVITCILISITYIFYERNSRSLMRIDLRLTVLQLGPYNTDNDCISTAIIDSLYVSERCNHFS